MSKQCSAVDIMLTAGMAPDPWQREMLENPSRCILRNCARQVGKTAVAAAAALESAMRGCDVMVVAPTKRQSAELARAVVRGVKTEGQRFEKGLFTVGTGSITITPGYTGPQRPVDLLIIDDAARADLLDIVRAHWMLQPGGKVIALSTPAGRKGWFYEAHMDAEENGWDYREVTADLCHRFPLNHLDDARQDMTCAQFEAEYLCQFVAA